MKGNGEVAKKKLVPKKQKMEEVEDDFITLEILSRFPVKSLMRFKCICKRWNSIIQKDQFFISLHLSRSITTTRSSTSILIVGKKKNDRMFLFSAELLPRSNEEDGYDLEVGATWLWEPPVPKEHPVLVSNCLNGLICFMDTKSFCARVYNSSTRESTPWMKSIIKQHEDKNVASFVKHEVGYDPATKEHKVIALWNLGHDVVCEVLTVGQNSWRRIDGIDHHTLHEIRSSVYVNGSIWLLCHHQEDRYFYLSILEFSVGSEKFGKFKTVALSIGRRIQSGPSVIMGGLMEVNDRLCVLKYSGTRTHRSKYYYTCTRRSITMCMPTKFSSLSAYGSSTTSISLPDATELNSIRHIPGTDLFIIRTIEGDFYYYDQKNKSCRCISKINCEISATMKAENGKLPYRFEFYNFTPNLLPVN